MKKRNNTKSGMTPDRKKIS